MAPDAAPAALPTFRAVQYARNGDSSVLQVVQVPAPQRRKGEVLVAVKASGVNGLDVKLRGGMGGWLMGAKLPAIPGCELAGVVLEADKSSEFKFGDRVFAQLPSQLGSYAERAAVPEAALARIPDGWSADFLEAAAAPVAALAAWQCLDAAGLEPGQRVLIHAGAGGVGSVAIQLAKARGLAVATTCSGRNVAFCRSLGADQVIDYTSQMFEEALADVPVHAVIDSIAVNGYEERSLALVARSSGTYVMLLSAMLPLKILKGLAWSALGLGPRYRVVATKARGDLLAQAGALLESGKVRVTVGKVLRLERAAEAQDETAKGHNRGKIVLRI
eukprot:scaffold2.g6850.t1